MENENKDKVVLNEEELKEVAGGAPFFGGISAYCKALNMKRCYEAFECKWEKGACVQNPDL